MCMLAEYLNIPFDSERGLFKLGDLPEVARQTLLAQAHAQFLDCPVTSKMTDGWESCEADRVHHPMGDTLEGMTCAWMTGGKRLDSAFIAPFLPHPAQSPSLDNMFIVGDYIGLHDDTALTDKDQGIIVVLLDAPKGCKLMYNNDQFRDLTPGEIWLMDDYPDHAAYPLFAYEGMSEEIAADPVKLQSHIQNNCMTFLIVAKYHFDADIQAA
jgi:hypothetical protein